MPKAGKEDVRQLIRAQRDALGDLLESLSDAEWDLASLCTGWRVRDVVAHCVQSHVATPWTFASEWIASGFSLKVRNERWVARRRPRSRSEVIDEYRATAVRLAIPAAETPYALVEAVIHGYDIAWPLGRTIEVPATSLVVVADTCRRTSPFLHSKQRCAGLALRASDVSWSAGSGPQVAGAACVNHHGDHWTAGSARRPVRQRARHAAFAALTRRFSSGSLLVRQFGI